MNIGYIRVPHNFLAMSPQDREANETSEEDILLSDTVKRKISTKEGNNVSKYMNLLKLIKGTIALHAVSCIIITIGSLIKLGSDGGANFGNGSIWRIASCWTGPRPSISSTQMLPEITYGRITNRMSESMGFERLYIIAFLLIVFFFLSAMFQFMSIMSENHQNNILQNKPQWFRYMEYSLSASCMMVAIFISFGMLDSYLHICVFTLTFLCMVIGLAADTVRYLTDTTGNTTDSIQEPTLMKFRLVALRLHYIGWVPILIVWGILWVVVFDMAHGTFWELCENKIQGGKLPDFVWIVVIGEFLLFTVFGYVQLVQFGKQFDINWYKIENLKLVKNTSFLHTKSTYDPATTGLATERSFVILSLVAKSLLGWTIFSQVVVA
jgi:Heliorhodopsin